MILSVSFVFLATIRVLRHIVQVYHYLAKTGSRRSGHISDDFVANETCITLFAK